MVHVADASTCAAHRDPSERAGGFPGDRTLAVNRNYRFVLFAETPIADEDGEDGELEDPDEGSADECDDPSDEEGDRDEDDLDLYPQQGPDEPLPV